MGIESYDRADRAAAETVRLYLKYGVPAVMGSSIPKINKIKGDLSVQLRGIVFGHEQQDSEQYENFSYSASKLFLFQGEIGARIQLSCRIWKKDADSRVYVMTDPGRFNPLLRNHRNNYLDIRLQRSDSSGTRDIEYDYLLSRYNLLIRDRDDALGFVNETENIYFVVPPRALLNVEGVIWGDSRESIVRQDIGLPLT